MRSVKMRRKFTWQPSSSSFSSWLPPLVLLLGCGGFLFLLLLFLLLLIHGSGDKQIHDRLGHHITVIVKLKLSEDVINLILIEFVSECCENMNKLVLHEDVPLDHLTLDLLLNFFIKGLKCTNNEVIGIVDTSSHLCSEHLDHVVVVAGPAHLAQHGIELIILDQSADIVEGGSQVILVDDTVLVNVHETEAFLVNLEGSLVKLGGCIAFSVTLSHVDRVFKNERSGNSGV